MKSNEKIYSKAKHLELLKLKENSQFLTSEEAKLSNFQSLVGDYIFWKDRHHYTILINNFNIGLMDFEEFEFSFYRLWDQSMKEIRFINQNERELKNLEISNSS